MTKSYVLQGPNYYRYDVETDAVDAGYPRAIAAGWTGLDPSLVDGVDCALDLGDGRLYLFDGDSYQRVDQVANAAPAAARTISEGWAGMAEAGFTAGLDAALNLGGDVAMFFRGNECVAFEITADRVAQGYPRLISDEWPGLAERGFSEGLDAAVRWPDGRIFFFKGAQYLRYDRESLTVTGEPRSIADGWSGLPDQSVDAFWVKSAANAHEPLVQPNGKLGPGDHVWYWNGLVSTDKSIPRQAWFGNMAGFEPNNDTDYRNNGTDIYNFVIHADGVILRGQPHMKAGAGTFGWLNRNPGNLTGKVGGRDFGQYRDKFNWHNFMIFPTMELGRAAIIPFILNWGPMTISDAMERYAPAKDGNDPVTYAAEVAAAAGVPVTALTTSLTPDQLAAAEGAINHREGVREGTTLSIDSPELPDAVRALL